MTLAEIQEKLDKFIGRRRAHFNVEPRYSAGSPAYLTLRCAGDAFRVRANELALYPGYLDGMCGEELQRDAERRGFEGIVEARVETRKGWDTLDLITGRRWVRPFEKVA